MCLFVNKSHAFIFTKSKKTKQKKQKKKKMRRVKSRTMAKENP